MAKEKKKNKKKTSDVEVKAKKNKKKATVKKDKKKKSVKKVSSKVDQMAVYETLTRLSNLVNKISNEPILYHGNSFYRAELAALKVIKDNEPITTAQLADELQVTRSAVLKTVNKLVHKGLIEKQKSQANRRVNEIVLTEEGQAFMRSNPDNKTKLQKPIMEALEKMGETELAYFNDGLERIMINLI